MKGPLAETARLSPALFWRTRPLPASPLTVPPTVRVTAAQVTATLVTFEAPTVPAPFATVQVWAAGWLATVTA